MDKNLEYFVYNNKQYYHGVAKDGRGFRTRALAAARLRMTDDLDSKNWTIIYESDEDFSDQKRILLLSGKEFAVSKPRAPVIVREEHLNKTVGTYKPKKIGWIWGDVDKITKICKKCEEKMKRKSWPDHVCDAPTKPPPPEIKYTFKNVDVDMRCCGCAMHYSLTREKLQQGEIEWKRLVESGELGKVEGEFGAVIYCLSPYKKCGIRNTIYAPEYFWEVIKGKEERNEYYKNPSNENKKFRCPECDIKKKIGPNCLAEGKERLNRLAEYKFMRQMDGYILSCDNCRNEYTSGNFYIDEEGNPQLWARVKLI